MKLSPPRSRGRPFAELANRWHCRKVVRRWRHAKHRTARKHRLQRLTTTLPGWHTLGQVLYYIGFQTEYLLLRLGRALVHAFYFLLGALALPVRLAVGPLINECHELAAVLAAPHRIHRLLPWLMPVCGAAALLFTVKTTLSRPFVLEVQVNGDPIGYIESEADFEAARAELAGRISSAKAAIADSNAPLPEGGLDVWPTYTLAHSDETMRQSELTDAMLRATGGQVCEGTAVYIDGELRCVITEGDHLRSFLERCKAPYEDAYNANRQVGFAHRIQLVDGLFLQASVKPYNEAIADLQGNGSLLQVKVSELSSYEEAIPYGTVREESNVIPYGQEEVVQTGANGVQLVTQVSTYIDGELTDVSVTAREVLQAPVSEVIQVGTQLPTGMQATTDDGYSFIWPVPQYRRVSRWMYYGHNGTDIAASLGTPILASASGTVSTVYSWNGVVTRGDLNSYGNYVVIDHAGGYRTLYGHMSYYIVSEGQWVEQGQVIGYVGSTGYSTGPHCHFEMYGPQGRFSARELFPTMHM